MKLMKHPQHGFHHAMSPNDEATMRSNGWADEADEQQPAEEAPTQQAPTELAPVAANPTRKKKLK